MCELFISKLLLSSLHLSPSLSTCVYEGVAKGFADVLVGESPLWIHDAAGKLAHSECFLVLSLPPVVLCPVNIKDLSLT